MKTPEKWGSGVVFEMHFWRQAARNLPRLADARQAETIPSISRTALKLYLELTLKLVKEDLAVLGGFQ